MKKRKIRERMRWVKRRRGREHRSGKEWRVKGKRWKGRNQKRRKSEERKGRRVKGTKENGVGKSNKERCPDQMKTTERCVQLQAYCIAKKFRRVKFSGKLIRLSFSDFIFVDSNWHYQWCTIVFVG